MDLKIKKVGGSKFLLVPQEFNKVYNLDKFVYDINVSSDGNTITYSRKVTVEEFEEAEKINIPTENVDLSLE